MKTCFFHTLFLLSTYLTFGQSVSGRVQEPGGKPLAFANVLLVNSKDSSLVKGAVATDAGRFVLERVPAGSYRVAVSAVGYRKVFTDAFNLSGQQSMTELPAVVAAPETGLLGEVTVKAQKPLFEQQMDKLVVNVQSMVTAAGNTALDVLERSPGVVLNRQSNMLALAGKSGVVVMINGKISRLPMDAILQMLGGMNAANIERVELILNPSARYDAEGDAGMINIVLRKDASQGTNGSFNLTAGYGRYEKLNGGVSLNHRVLKLNLFGDYAAMRDRGWTQLSTYSDLTFENQFTQNRTVKTAYNTRPTQNLRLGFDYALSQQTSVGGLLTGFSNAFRSRSPSHQEVYQSGRLTQQVDVLDREKNRWRHGMVNLNLRHQVSPGRELSVDIDYLRYANSNPHDYTNAYRYVLDQDRNETELLRTRKETPIRIWVLKGDYTMTLTPKTRLELGAKATLMSLNNDVRVDYFRMEAWQPDPVFSQIYDLRDDIMAGYVNLSHTLNPTTKVQAGLRYEHTHTDIGRPGEVPAVQRRYGSFFPSVFWSRDLSKTSSLQLSYSRRVQRPSYDLLAPWVLFVNPYSFVTGNPNLLPTFTDAVQTTYRFKSSYLLTLKFSHDRNALDRFRVRIDSITNRTYVTPENVRAVNTLSLLFSFPVNLTPWWKMQTNLTGVGQRIEATAEGKPIALRLFNANVFTMHSFTLPYDVTGEITAFYNTPALWGISRMRANGSVNVGAKKKLPGNGGSLTLNVNDLFWTSRYRLITDNPAVGQVGGWQLMFEPRVFRLTYSNTFGSKTVKAVNRRATASEEERGRVSTN
ncbi:TonB-dependent receptor [Fibrisoma montanum]|uniref:TonB-dependent receptor n=1 Tax=Fibrisoma montanum TaxID=2305895 RepID=A0A418M5H0_9BACT|nr:TonB dependent receptor [Fibrisoma montanum]RIV21199.1 TonB-dependent receptor [Fibrisoma montanum]